MTIRGDRRLLLEWDVEVVLGGRLRETQRRVEPECLVVVDLDLEMQSSYPIGLCLTTHSAQEITADAHASELGVDRESVDPPLLRKAVHPQRRDNSSVAFAHHSRFIWRFEELRLSGITEGLSENPCLFT